MTIAPALRSRVLSLLPGDGWRLSQLVDSHNLVLRARRDATDLVVRLQPTSRMSAATADALVGWLQVLAGDADLHVPRPIRLPTGAHVAELEYDGRAYLCRVVTWVPGERAPDAQAFVDADRLRSVGATVARLHAHAATLPAATGRNVPALAAFLHESEPPGSMALRASMPSDLYAQLREARERMAAVLAEPSGPQEVGLVHADLEPQNWVFDEGQPGVIDFDELRFGPFAADLLGVLWTHAMWDGYPGYRANLFEGYETIRALPPRTRKDADMWMAIQFASWLDFVFRELSEEARDRHLRYVEPMVERIVAWCHVG